MATRITISSELIETVKKHVFFETRADLNNFVQDALQTYISLGTMTAQGHLLYMQRTDCTGMPLQRLRLPLHPEFDLTDGSDA